MGYIDFYKQWREVGCFSIHQVLAWYPDFNLHNISNWINKGYIMKLRNGWYAFHECLSLPDFQQYIANRIYRPSYISLHTALSHYGMIPEEVMKTTSVTTLKTAEFKNAFGVYAYQMVKRELMFGYQPKPMADLFFSPRQRKHCLIFFIFISFMPRWMICRLSGLTKTTWLMISTGSCFCNIANR